MTVVTGTATFSVAATTSVDSSTLSAASSTSGGSSGGTSSKTASGSAVSPTESNNGAVGMSLSKFALAFGLLGFVFA